MTAQTLVLDGGLTAYVPVMSPRAGAVPQDDARRGRCRGRGRMTAPASRTGAHAAELDGKVALVTGAAQGQGRAYAARLAQEGANLVLLDRCEQILSLATTWAPRRDWRRPPSWSVTLAAVPSHARLTCVTGMPSPPPRPTGSAGWMSSWQRGNLHVAAMDAVTFEVWNATLVHLPAITGGCYRLLAGGRATSRPCLGGRAGAGRCRPGDPRALR